MSRFHPPRVPEDLRATLITVALVFGVVCAIAYITS